MAVPTTTTWKIDPHTLAKHQILSGYLKAWFGIVGNRFGQPIYVDGFCGPGRYPRGEPGSPLLALQAALEHQDVLRGGAIFHFTDYREDRIRNLRSEVDALAGTLPGCFQVQITTATFRDYISPKIEEWRGTPSLAPIFAFVDPRGYSGIPFSAIQGLLALPHAEVFITLMVDFLNRFLDHPNRDITEHILETYGTKEVLAIREGQGDRVGKLIDLYHRRLRSDTCAAHVLHFNMINRLNHILYSLFFATKHPLGLERMKDAMWKVDPQGDLSFADPKDRDSQQLSLLLSSDPADKLEEIIIAEFRGQQHVGVERVWRYVNETTIYQRKHMVTALRRAKQSGQIIAEPRKANGEKYIRGFPDEAVVSFTAGV